MLAFKLLKNCNLNADAQDLIFSALRIQCLDQKNLLMQTMLILTQMFQVETTCYFKIFCLKKCMKWKNGKNFMVRESLLSLICFLFPFPWALLQIFSYLLYNNNNTEGDEGYWPFSFICSQILIKSRFVEVQPWMQWRRLRTQWGPWSACQFRWFKLQPNVSDSALSKTLCTVQCGAWKRGVGEPGGVVPFVKLMCLTLEAHGFSPLFFFLYCAP